METDNGVTVSCGQGVGAQVANASGFCHKPQKTLVAVRLSGPFEDGERVLGEIPVPQQQAIRQALGRVGEPAYRGAVVLDVAPSGTPADRAIHQDQAQRVSADSGPDRIEHVRWARVSYIGVKDGPRLRRRHWRHLVHVGLQFARRDEDVGAWTAKRSQGGYIKRAFRIVDHQQAAPGAHQAGNVAPFLPPHQQDRPQVLDATDLVAVEPDQKVVVLTVIGAVSSRRVRFSATADAAQEKTRLAGEATMDLVRYRGARLVPRVGGRKQTIARGFFPNLGQHRQIGRQRFDGRIVESELVDKLLGNAFGTPYPQGPALHLGLR